MVVIIINEKIKKKTNKPPAKRRDSSELIATEERAEGKMMEAIEFSDWIFQSLQV